MEKVVREALLAVYLRNLNGYSAGLTDDLELYSIYKNIFTVQKAKLLESIRAGNRDISFGVFKVGETFFIDRFGNNLESRWEDGTSDWPSPLELEKYKVQKPVIEQTKSLLGKLFEEGLRETDEGYARVEKKAKYGKQ